MLSSPHPVFVPAVNVAINSASGFGCAIPDLDFYMNACST